jgi:hypothetical protein
MIENLLGGGGGGGTVDTIQAGTGISVNSTDPANPIVTLGNHDASLITTGTVATARLGTGTANSSTYLRGDQTWASVAAGDTTYALTVLDAENTTQTRDIVSFTIPANSLADGEIISIDTVTDSLNNSGSTASISVRTVVNGTANSSYSTSYSTSALVWQDKQRLNIWRSGSTLFISLPTTWAEPVNDGFTLRVQDSYYASGYATSLTPNFSADITVAIRVQWTVANAATYLRVRNARVVKQSGQYT